MKKLSVTEMKTVQGGGWLKEAWNYIMGIHNEAQRRREAYSELIRYSK